MEGRPGSRHAGTHRPSSRWCSRSRACSLFVFMATDVLLFYVFFEATLIPMYFLIGGFGGARRAYAAVEVPAVQPRRRAA